MPKARWEYPGLYSNMAAERAKKGYVTKRVAPQGYVAVTKPLARTLYEQGKDVTICGSNVNSLHVFGGWRLGYTVNITDTRARCSDEMDFQDLVNNYTFYLEPEMGRTAVFYIKKEALP